MNSIPPIHRGPSAPIRRMATPDDHHLDPQRPGEVEEPERRPRETPPAPPASEDRPDHHLDPRRPDSEPETW